MIQDYSQATVCVVDNGLFADVATTLTQYFGRVLLYVPIAGSWPTAGQFASGRGLPSMHGRRSAFNARDMVGNGLMGVEKVDDVLLIMDEVDLFIFPDSYLSPLQVYLRSKDKLVFGSGFGEELELDRLMGKETKSAVGLAVGEYEVVVGVDALRKRLQDRPGVVKWSYARGEKETFTSRSYFITDGDVDELAYKLGPLKYIQQFIVEEILPVDQMIEIGSDVVNIDGQYSDGIVGIETKDRCYIARFLPKTKFPQQLADILQRLAPYFADNTYRNFYSNEVLIEPVRMGLPGRGFDIDDTCRWGNPPGPLMARWYKNLADILMFGARGILIEPEPVSEWGCQLNVIAPRARNHYSALEIPAELRGQVFVHFPVVVNGRTYTLPMQPHVVSDYDNPAVCATVGWGDSMEAAIQEAISVAEQIGGQGLILPTDALEAGADKLARLGEFGISLE